MVGINHNWIGTMGLEITQSMIPHSLLHYVQRFPLQLGNPPHWNKLNFCWCNSDSILPLSVTFTCTKYQSVLFSFHSFIFRIHCDCRQCISLFVSITALTLTAPNEYTFLVLLASFTEFTYAHILTGQWFHKYSLNSKN